MLNSQTSTKHETPAQQKGIWECRKYLCYETESKHTQWRSRHSSQVVSRKSLQLSTYRTSNIGGRAQWAPCLKNNVRGVTLVRRPSLSYPANLVILTDLTSVDKINFVRQWDKQEYIYLIYQISSTSSKLFFFFFCFFVSWSMPKILPLCSNSTSFYISRLKKRILHGNTYGNVTKCAVALITWLLKVSIPPKSYFRFSSSL